MGTLAENTAMDAVIMPNQHGCKYWHCQGRLRVKKTACFRN